MRTAGPCLRMRRDRRRPRGILMLSSSDATGEGNKQVEPRSKAGIDAGAASTIMSLLTGAWAARLVHTAAELGIADHLADGPRGVDVLPPKREHTHRRLPAYYAPSQRSACCMKTKSARIA